MEADLFRQVLTILNSTRSIIPNIKGKWSAGSYLKNKYGLEVRATRKNSYMDYDYSAYERKAKSLIRIILNANSVNEHTCVLCGDLAIVIYALAKGVYLYPGNLIGYYSCLKSETWDSLHHMGRGRGDDYALKLIKDELKKWDINQFCFD